MRTRRTTIVLETTETWTLRRAGSPHTPCPHCGSPLIAPPPGIDPLALSQAMEAGQIHVLPDPATAPADARLPPLLCLDSLRRAAPHLLPRDGQPQLPTPQLEPPKETAS